MKQVSFKVAKAIKEAGYPQFDSETIYVLEDFTQGNVVIPKGAVKTNYSEDNNYLHPVMEWAAIPTYIEVWLWLWREKKIQIEIDELSSYIIGTYNGVKFDNEFFIRDPEDAIAAAIEYLVDGCLIW